MRSALAEKMKESALAVLPIGFIILVLHFTIAPLPAWMVAAMLVGMFLLFLGMGLFLMGVDLSMLPIGQHIGAALISSRKLPLIIGVLFVFGFVATLAEPDLSVLADQIASIPTHLLLLSFSVGVGVFLVIAVFRVIFHWKLGRVLSIAYPAAFIIAIFSSDYLAVAVDSAAVTTGPVTVPFLLAIGSGFASMSQRKDAVEDNFGISAICSVGPIISVLILSMFFDSSETRFQEPLAAVPGSGRELISQFGGSLWHSFTDVLLILLPILGVFLIFQIVKLRLSRSELIRIFVGLVYLLVGMTIFLCGVNEGFLPAAMALGERLGSLDYNWVLIPVCLVIGASVVLAEPTVYVLVNQVREITHGAIPKKLLLSAMALGVGVAMTLSVVRILAGFSIWWILVPGYALSLGLSLTVPNMFVGIGFDAGEVVTGAMSAAFVIPFAIGVCNVVPGGNVVKDAFGIAGVLTMIPPIIIQTIGLIYSKKLKRAEKLDLEAALDGAEAAEADM